MYEQQQQQSDARAAHVQAQGGQQSIRITPHTHIQRGVTVRYPFIHPSILLLQQQQQQQQRKSTTTPKTSLTVLVPGRPLFTHNITRARIWRNLYCLLFCMVFIFGQTWWRWAGGTWAFFFYHGMIAVSYIIMSGSGWQACLGGSDMN